MLRLYLAAPLFTPLERSFNADLAMRLAPYFCVFLPQRDGVLIPGNPLRNEEFRQLSRQAYSSDVAAISAADVVLAVLDGRSVDEGVAFELGYATALGKQCVALKTDSRVLLPHGDNPMIACSTKIWLTSIEQLDAWARSSAASAS